MRLLYTISFLFPYLLFLFAAVGRESCVAQEHRIVKAIIQQQNTETVVNYRLFKEQVNTKSEFLIPNSAVQNMGYLKVDIHALAAIHTEKPALISFPLPTINGDIKTVILMRYDIRSEDFNVYAKGGSAQRSLVSFAPFVSYRGFIAGDSVSVAAFTFANNEVSAIFSTHAEGNYNLVLNYSHPGTEKENYLLFRESDIRGQQKPVCALTDEILDFFSPPAEQETPARGQYSSCNRLRLSIHADYQLYTRRSEDVDAVTFYVAAVFNGAAVLFENEGINLVLSELVINTTPDGYTFGSSTEVLFRFGSEIQAEFNGDIAHMLTGARPNGWASLGGLAWLDVLCWPPGIRTDQQGNSVWFGPYSMSNPQVLNSVPEVPVYSWDVNAFTHEVGHNIGSRHTQSCTWPGGAIDNCVAPEDGNCSPGPNPGRQGGTIMSYCHLVSSVGVNFALGFGPLPGNLIREKVSSASCLTSSIPLYALDTPATERIANRICNDGVWMYYYYDNNTSMWEDDELLLIISTEDPEGLGDSIEVKVTTSALYNSGTATAANVPYAGEGWTEINRTWRVLLPERDIVYPLMVRFPFTEQDIDDIRGAFPSVNDPGELTLVAFRSQEAAENIMNTNPLSVRFYNNASGADTASWRLGQEGNYMYAEFAAVDGIFGGSLGILPSIVSVHKYNDKQVPLKIYPNPVQNDLYVQVDFQINENQYIDVIDCMGKKVITKQISGGAEFFMLDVAALPSGIYFLRFVQGSNTCSSFFVKN